MTDPAPPGERLRRRAAILWRRHRRAFWILHSLWALAFGVVVLWLAHERYGFQDFKLKGGVRLTRGKGWITAERASIDIPTQKVTLHDVKGSIPVDRPKR